MKKKYNVVRIRKNYLAGRPHPWLWMSRKCDQKALARGGAGEAAVHWAAQLTVDKLIFIYILHQIHLSFLS